MTSLLMTNLIFKGKIVLEIENQIPIVARG